MKTRRFLEVVVLVNSFVVGFTAAAILTEKKSQYNVIISDIPKEIPIVETSIDEVEEDYGDSYTSLGEFKVTFYCGGACCNSEKYAGWSASNKRLENGMCAADPSIPFGTELYLSAGINGVMECYTVEDRGSGIRGNHLDIFVSDHKLANQLGVIYTEVFIKN